MEPEKIVQTTGLGGTRIRGGKIGEKRDSLGNDHHFEIVVDDHGKKLCPRCQKIMQKSGQKADSNGVIKQRFLCPGCKRKGETPYNFFFSL